MKLFATLLFAFLFSIPARAEIVVAWAGQSLCQNMFTDESVWVTPSSNTRMWDQGSASWVSVTGAGAKEYANMLSAQTGQQVSMITACAGGTPLLASGYPPWPNGYWTSTAVDSPLTYLVSQVNGSGKKPNILQFNGGQNDYMSSAPNEYGDFYNGLGMMYGYLLSQWGLTTSQMPMNVWVTGLTNYGTSQHVNAAQVAFATSQPGARLGATYYDLTYTDYTHVDAASSIIMGDRQARIDLRGLGVSGFGCSTTPRILGGWMVSATVIEIITDTPCGLNTYSWSSGLSGFKVYSSNWGVQGTINGAWLSGSPNWWGTSIYVSLASYIGQNVNVQYMPDQYAGTYSPSFNGDWALGVRGNPVAPLPYGFQTPN